MALCHDDILRKSRDRRREQQRAGDEMGDHLFAAELHLGQRECPKRRYRDIPAHGNGSNEQAVEYVTADMHPRVADRRGQRQKIVKRRMHDEKAGRKCKDFFCRFQRLHNRIQKGEPHKGAEQ